MSREEKKMAEENNKLILKSLNKFKGKKEYVYIKKEKKMTEEENKKLKELLEKVSKIISTPIDGFKDKSYKELGSVVRDIHELDRRLMRYTHTLDKIQKFNNILDSFNRKDDYETMFETYCGEIHHADGDDIPF